MLEFLSMLAMLSHALTRKKVIGFLAWLSFGLVWLLKTNHYIEVLDYYNTAIMILAFLLFTFIGLTILKANNNDVFADLSLLAFTSSFIYFIFALTWLRDLLIVHTANMTVLTAKLFGFTITKFSEKTLQCNGRYVEIILACTGIESMSLFAGIVISTKAELRRKFYAFLVSIPVIYVLNLLRNVFITSAFGNQWFGENSFYIAHHVISKILATIALILISLAVFKLLPEFADFIYKVKDEVIATWREQESE